MEFNTYNAENNSELRKLQLTILDIIKLFRVSAKNIILDIL